MVGGFWGVLRRWSLCHRTDPARIMDYIIIVLRPSATKTRQRSKGSFAIRTNTYLANIDIIAYLCEVLRHLALCCVFHIAFSPWFSTSRLTSLSYFWLSRLIICLPRARLSRKPVLQFCSVHYHDLMTNLTTRLHRRLILQVTR